MEFATLEACYRDLFRRPAVDLAPAFVDVLARRSCARILDGPRTRGCAAPASSSFAASAWRRGRELLAADAATDRGYRRDRRLRQRGERLLRAQNTPTPR
jgi:hypothetical protein